MHSQLSGLHPHVAAWLATRLVDRDNGHRRRVLAAFDDRRRNDFFTRQLIEDRRRENLANLLAHAKAQVPWFQERLAGHKITPQRAMEALAALPLMRRSDIQADPASFVAGNAVVTAEDHTGGSTGTPMSFKVDASTQIAREASLMWADGLAGWQYGERIAMLWGSHRDVDTATQRLKLSLRWWLDNRRWYNAFDMGESEMADFHRHLRSFRPHLLVAYAGSIFSFARFLKEHGYKVDYPLRSIISSAEVLTADMRKTVEGVFGRPVHDRYGNRECGAIAAECTYHQGLHVNESDCIVEIDSSDPHRVPGPVVVTYLRNYAMPLIRYNTGDVARFEPHGICPCGRTTLRLAPVLGRESDMIRTSSGALIHGEYFTHLFYGENDIVEFQFVQEALKKYVLRLVADPAKSAEREAQWRAKILEAVGRSSELRIEYVDQIPLLKSGKRRFTISLLNA
jgi:phenylacetate-CoA ligase